MPFDPRVHVGVCAIVHRVEDNALLMVQRTGTASYADGRGTWAVPGGWLEFGEDPLYAAAREVFEETGVNVTPVEKVGFASNLSDDLGRYIVTLFVGCRYVSGEPRVTEPDKCGSVEWVRDLQDGRPLFLVLRNLIAERGVV